MSNFELSEIEGYSPAVTRWVVERVGPVLRKWFRAEIHGLDSFPADGGALVVSNHSGGMLTPDVMLFGSAFYRRFGYVERPLFTLAHYGVVMGPLGDLMPKVGVIEASRENAAAALGSGGVVLVFPGGDYDSYRPTTADKRDRLQWQDGIREHRDRGWRPDRALGVDRRAGEPTLPDPRQRTGQTAGSDQGAHGDPPHHVRLPVRVQRSHPAQPAAADEDRHAVLAPIHVTDEFGSDPDVDEVDAHVRHVMQEALNELSRKRRFPVLG